MFKELRVTLVLVLVIGFGTLADSCTSRIPHPPVPETNTVEAIIHNQTAFIAHVALERCGYAAQYVGLVSPFHTDTLLIPSRLAPPGSAVSFRARTENMNESEEHFTSLTFALPPHADWPLLTEWNLRTQRVEARRAR